jgi:GNAT superfamily N-acetyltransferase
MAITVSPVQTVREKLQFVKFAWRVYQGDPNWVPPLISDQLNKLNTQDHPFWQTADLKIWMVKKDGRAAGRIAAIIDHHGNQVLGEPIGTFGFFECLHDQECAGRLFDTAIEWLKQRGCTRIRGPYNPSSSDECGILVEGFQTRPALMMSHHPVYYQNLLEDYGFYKYNDLLARLWTRPPAVDCVEDTLPKKMVSAALKASQRPDLRIRSIQMEDWENEISMACDIYNRALNDLPGYITISQAEFSKLAGSFKSLVDPLYTLIAEIGSKPVAFGVTLPDINEALLHIDGKLDFVGLAKLWWYSRHLHRACFKILMVDPDYQNRGIEAVLGLQIARALWNAGFQEIDLSLTGEENIKSTRFQENLRFQIYRRYRLYEKMI